MGPFIFHPRSSMPALRFSPLPFPLYLFTCFVTQKSLPGSFVVVYESFPFFIPFFVIKYIFLSFQHIHFYFFFPFSFYFFYSLSLLIDFSLFHVFCFLRLFLSDFSVVFFCCCFLRLCFCLSCVFCFVFFVFRGGCCQVSPSPSSIFYFVKSFNSFLLFPSFTGFSLLFLCLVYVLCFTGFYRLGYMFSFALIHRLYYCLFCALHILFF